MPATSQNREKFEDYDAFVEKFKPKLTTDDCYTPPEIYEIVADYACERFGIDRESIVRPFYPGGDYEAEDYDGKVVVDNPPFSILAKIKRFYLERGVPFFLFCPSMTAFSGAMTESLTHILCDACITYENGAVVCTAFVTNMGGDVVAESEPDLGRAINDKVRELAKVGKVELPKYVYPDEVLTAAKLNWMAKHGERLRVMRGDCRFVRKIDAQDGKAIFGGGLLLSERAAAERAAAERAAAERAAAERAAAERAAAERAAAHVFELSDREREISRSLGDE